MKFKVGDKVKLNKNITRFTYNRAGVSYEEIGTITYVKEDKYTYKDLKKSPIGTKITFENGEILIKDDKEYYENRYTWRNEECFEKLEDNEKVLGKIIKIEEPEYTTVYEYKTEILDEAEKRYLRGVIKPFRDKVKGIKKEIKCLDEKNEEEIMIWLKDRQLIRLPGFKPNTMYKRMELYKEYTLEELGL